MKLGEVEILPFDGGENIAQFVAFAASVKGMSSSASAIKSIAKKIGEFTKEEKSVRSVVVPLLGTGAGGLRDEDVVIALREGFVENAAPGATLTIRVLHKEVFDRLRIVQPTKQNQPRMPLRVFISHTSTEASATDWVKNLALFLIEQGIQARLDRFHLRRGMDLPQWMCNELAMANKVIVICDEKYKEKADGRLGGVGWETMIIQGDLMKLSSDSTKYQVVVRAHNLSGGLPQYLQTKYAYHIPPSGDEESFRSELVQELLDLPLDHRLDANEFSL
ncbi:MAG: toll/interleukin-1 receptor domain-containing protein [Proteobacteria bacterium]|nr:toll/interleukin-1 receptor domain-containing protein [Pseudomonadota bacterium]